MAIHEDKWFEFWYTGVDILPTYFLIVTTDSKNLGRILVLDPLKSNEIIFDAKNYDEACAWLWDDDFHIAEGRIFYDDPW